MLIVLFSTHLLWAKQAVLPNFIQDAETSIMFVINQLWHRTLHNYRKTHTPMCFSLIYQPQNQDGRKRDVSPLPSPANLYICCLVWGQGKSQEYSWKQAEEMWSSDDRKEAKEDMYTLDMVIRWQKGSQGRYVHTRSGHQMTERKPRKKSTHCFHTSLPRCDSAAQRTCRKYWRRTQLCHHTCLYKKKKKKKRFTVTPVCTK